MSDNVNDLIVELGQHLSWLHIYAEDAKASDWRDMRLRSIQQTGRALETLQRLREAIVVPDKDAAARALVAKWREKFPGAGWPDLETAKELLSYGGHQ